MNYDFGVKEISFEDSTIGKAVAAQRLDTAAQIGELKRIADAAEHRAELAAQEAVSAKKDARFSKIVSIISVVISLASLAISAFSAFFPL